MSDRDISRRTMLMTGSAALLSACTVQVRRGEGGVTQAARDDVWADLPRMLRIAAVPGVSVAMVDGTRVDTRAAGVVKAGGTDAVDADTVFEAASLSKPVFAYLVLGLVAEGKLDLDRPLREYLELPNPADERARTITARHALSHATGWRNWRNNASQPLVSDFVPGSAWSYSGEGFYFLSRVVEKVTGQGILRLTRDRVLAPLGMARSSYMWTPALDANRAEPHTNRGVAGDSFGVRGARAYRDAAAAEGKSMDEWRHEDAERLIGKVNKDFPALPNFLLPNVAGSLLTTARDYGAFLRHLLAGDGRATLARMMEKQVTLNEALAWGLGVGLETEGGTAQLWHWGDNFGFKNFVVGDPASRRAVVVFTNGQNGRAIYERVVRAVRGDQAAFLAI